jgi:calcineurin-like phosphoesterase family protein
MNDIYFQSDTHYNHKRIIELCNRPFSSVEEMDEILIENTNKKVKGNDTLYFLGDFTFSWKKDYIKYIRRRINCNRIIMVWGNHDKLLQESESLRNELFYDCHSDLFLKIDGKPIHLYHYPVLNWDKQHYGSIMLHGHIHSKTGKSTIDGRKIFDCGVDNCDYSPVSLDEIISKFN